LLKDVLALDFYVIDECCTVATQLFMMQVKVSEFMQQCEPKIVGSIMAKGEPDYWAGRASIAAPSRKVPGSWGRTTTITPFDAKFSLAFRGPFSFVLNIAMRRR
jgi:hypothetical protein